MRGGVYNVTGYQSSSRAEGGNVARVERACSVR